MMDRPQKVYRYRKIRSKKINKLLLVNMINNLLTNKPLSSNNDALIVVVLSAAPRDHKVWLALRVYRDSLV